jgi:hypothetical protein
MALKQTYKTPASTWGGVNGPNGTVDSLAVSDAVAIKRIAIPIANFTQNQTTRAYGGPLGVRGKLVGAYLSVETVPAGGTLSVQAAVYDASANAEVSLATIDPETLTASEGGALTLTAANNDSFTIEADDTIRALSVADNNAVSQQQANGYLVLLIAVVEPSAGALVTER